MEASPNVIEDSGRVAVMFGPLVYCAEGVDNGKNLHDVAIDPDGEFQIKFNPDWNANVLETTGYFRDAAEFGERLYRPAEKSEKTMTLKLIPYFAFANRGETEMVVWLKRK